MSATFELRMSCLTGQTLHALAKRHDASLVGHPYLGLGQET